MEQNVNYGMRYTRQQVHALERTIIEEIEQAHRGADRQQH